MTESPSSAIRGSSVAVTRAPWPRWAIWMVLVTALVLTAWYLGFVLGGVAQRVIGSLIFTATSGLAAALCWRAASLLGARRGWRFIGLACLAWFGGQLVWNVYNVLLRVPVPYPSLADVGFLLFYPLYFAGVVSFVRATHPSLSLQTILDGLVVTSVAALLAYELVLVPSGAHSHDPIAVVTSVLWQAGTAGLIMLIAVALLWTANPVSRQPLVPLLLGVASFLVSNVIYGRIALEGTYKVGSVIDLGWHFGFLLIGTAALLSTDRTDADRNSVPPDNARWRASGTVVSVLAFGWLAAATAWDPISSPVAATGIVVVALLIAARLAYAERQEAQLARRTRERDRLAAEAAADAATRTKMAAALAAQQHSNDELARLNQAKSEFVSVVSHEFRTPLTSIRGFAELLRDEDLDRDETREFAGIIEQNADRLARMINEMLDLDRLQSGRGALRREPVDLNAAVQEVVSALGLRLAQHTIQLALDPALPALSGDRDQVIRVVTNLLANAIKYSPAGSEVTVATERVGDMLQLRVRDRGAGIAPAALETIFDPFVRIPGSDEHVEGTGLGLPITRQLVELHGGRIWAESLPGAGSTFHVLFPALDPEPIGSGEIAPFSPSAG